MTKPIGKRKNRTVWRKQKTPLTKKELEAKSLELGQLQKESDRYMAPGLEENILVRVPLGTKAILKAAAEVEGLTVSALIRAAMTAVVKKAIRKAKK